jgi:hypothetical protein
MMQAHFRLRRVEARKGSNVRGVAVTVIALALGGRIQGAAAQEPSDADCNRSYVSVQQLQRDGRLIDARAQAIQCGQSTCSPTVRADCAQWLEAIDRAQPSVVVDVRDRQGRELNQVRVLSNNRVLTERLDGRALVIDPGRQVMRFEHYDQFEHYHQSEIVELTAREGEKFRLVRVVLAGAQPSAPHLPTPGVPSPADTGGDPLPVSTVATYALAGVGALSLATFGVLAASGYSKEKTLRRGCGADSSCSPGSVDAVRDLYWGADLALGVGCASAIGALGLWLLTPNAESRVVESRAAGGRASRAAGGRAVTARSAQLGGFVSPRAAGLTVQGSF